MMLKFTGSFAELKEKLSTISSNWDDSQENKKVLKINNGIMNWYESTGTINFQGKDPGRSTLIESVPRLLYPCESIDIRKTIDILPESEATEIFTPPIDGSLERQYLVSGMSEGELVIGIVSAVGTESRRVTDPLIDRLKGFDYSVDEIRVSSILHSFSGQSEYERIRHYMKEGDDLRRKSRNNAILAAGVAKKIAVLRQQDPSIKKRAYIINSLKHPSEIEFLRKIYGDGFYLIGIHADEKRRQRYLTDDKSCTQDQASELIKIDENESFDHGQKTRDTYHLSDFFLNLGNNNDQVKNGIQRFLELIFSHPYKNPTFDEFAMFMAFNSSVRSGDLSRQVGAVISRDKQIIATGANDVPKSGGGLYWAEVNLQTGEIEDHPDGKDYTRYVDSNKQTQSDIINEITKSLIDNGFVERVKEIEVRQTLKKSKISDLTEFGRVAHAEMDALLSCGRAGVSTTNTTLYCTTFPCHNCAKHIIASGVQRVVYVEPYPKSRALEFHSDSVRLRSTFDNNSPDGSKLVSFEPFIGIGPRRFLDLFSMTLGGGSKVRRKEKTGTTVEWSKTNAPIRTPLVPKSYLEIEKAASNIWDEYC